MSLLDDNCLLDDLCFLNNRSLLDDGMGLDKNNYYNQQYDYLEEEVSNNMCNINSILSKIKLYNTEENIIKVRCCFLWWILCINLLNIYMYCQIVERKKLVWYGFGYDYVDL